VKYFQGVQAACTRPAGCSFEIEYVCNLSRPHLTVLRKAGAQMFMNFYDLRNKSTEKLEQALAGELSPRKPKSPKSLAESWQTALYREHRKLAVFHRWRNYQMRELEPAEIPT
jgi:hypothetical protein